MIKLFETHGSHDYLTLALSSEKFVCFDKNNTSNCIHNTSKKETNELLRLFNCDPENQYWEIGKEVTVPKSGIEKKMFQAFLHYRHCRTH